MIRYNISQYRSRGGPTRGTGCSAPVSSATRARSLTPGSRRAPVHRSLAGSFAIHTIVLVALLALAGSRTVPIAPEQAPVAMVFQAAPAAAVQVSQSPPPVPAPPTVDVPSPPQPPVPPQMQAAPQPPLPVTPQQSQVTPVPPPPRAAAGAEPPPPSRAARPTAPSRRCANPACPNRARCRANQGRARRGINIPDDNTCRTDCTGAHGGDRSWLAERPRCLAGGP